MGMYKNGDVKHEEQRRDANRNESEEWMMTKLTKSTK